MGNPFPSAIEWGTADWALSNVGGVAQIWDESGNYTLINTGDIIPSTNGFFVQALLTKQLHQDTSICEVHDATNNYKSGRN